MGGNAKQEEELNVLLTKLYAIQEQVGAVEKTSSADRRARAENSNSSQQAASMGSSKKSRRTGSRFLELKSSIVANLKSVHGLVEEQSNSRSLDPKESIAAQAEIRELIREASDQWSEMSELYKREARKKKSKFSLEELEVQQTL